MSFRAQCESIWHHRATLCALFIYDYSKNNICVCFLKMTERGNFIKHYFFWWHQNLTNPFFSFFFFYTPPLSHTGEMFFFLNLETSFIWLWAYLFQVLIIKGDLGGARLSNTRPVVWSLLIGYKEINHLLIRTNHRSNGLKLNQRKGSLKCVYDASEKEVNAPQSLAVLCQ